MDNFVNSNTTTVDLIFPSEGLKQNAVLIAFGALIVALCAQIEIPLHPVPITGQTFGVLFIAALLGAKRGATSIMAYLTAGTAGLPVFAGGSAGIQVFAGPTAGYLIGFVFAAYLVGWLSELNWDHTFLLAVASMTLGTLVIFGFGAIGLVRFTGPEQVFQLGVLPFLPGAIIKIGLAATLLPQGRRLFS
ncbi:MAG: biotin transporter BioY [Candidatus Marinimicrobia bacterium]|nr:biotin transporter BioY [Candidatus Neomarinimicrobiota bacterium]MCF7850235.1 biotin transporter BioY [Candidatus Neomarinimicrobiota bacterium]MCF7903723.1 biotin transporter BioY [Candidatus Neomarinimicrobiota bacterium]